MKRWIILGVILSVLLAATISLLIGFFFMDISDAIDNMPTVTTGDEPFSTAPSADPTTEATTLPETTAPTEETAEDTTAPTEETTLPEETTEPPTEPPTEPTPPPTTEPTEPPTTAPTTQPTTQATTSAPDIGDQPQVVTGLSAKYGFVYNATEGAYLYTFGDQNARIKMASVTKIYSAWVALQYMDPNTVVTAGEEVRWIDTQSSRAWIYEGQKLKVETLVQGMIIPSGNDAAYILAVAAGREILDNNSASARDAFDAFVVEMNAQAQAQGLTGTHFANPDGIDHADHYTTAKDILTMAKLAMANPIISRAAATPSMTAHYASGETSKWTNSNHLLQSDSSDYRANAIGLKTGHTSGAGWCLVSAFDEDGTILIIGVFGSGTIDTRDTDTIKLYEEFR